MIQFDVFRCVWLCFDMTSFNVTELKLIRLDSKQPIRATMFNRQTTQSIRGGTVCGAEGCNLTSLKCVHRCFRKLAPLQISDICNGPICLGAVMQTWQLARCSCLYPAECSDSCSFFACLFYIALVDSFACGLIVTIYWVLLVSTQ